jgi:hypothetical protein
MMAMVLTAKVTSSPGSQASYNDKVAGVRTMANLLDTIIDASCGTEILRASYLFSRSLSAS